MKVFKGVAPARRPLVPALSTSLLPTQTDANVGRASSAFCTIVSPPRMSCVSGLASGPTTAVGSKLVIPGTATLLMIAVTDVGLRRAQVALVDAGCPASVTRVCVSRLLTGGGHPGMASDG